MTTTIGTADEIKARLDAANEHFRELSAVRGSDLSPMDLLARQEDIDNTNRQIAWLEREWTECPEAEGAVKLAGLAQQAKHWTASEHWSGT